MIDNKALNTLVFSLNECVLPELHLNKAGLTGFFYALTITPCIIDPSEWMAELFLGDRPDLNGRQVKRLKKAVVAVVKSANKSMLADKLEFPYDFSEIDEEMMADIWHWCYGFLRGINLRWSFWQSGIIAKETGQCYDLVKGSINIITALVTEDLSYLDNLEQLKSRIGGNIEGGASDERILAAVLPTLPEAYQCLRIFAATMSKRLQAHQSARASS